MLHSDDGEVYMSPEAREIGMSRHRDAEHLFHARGNLRNGKQSVCFLWGNKRLSM